MVADSGAANKSIKLIVVDQASLDFFEKEYALTWPIPRDAYGYIIDFLKQGGAKGLAFDLLFTESSAQSVEGDRALAAAAGGSLPVVSAVNVENYAKFVKPEKLEQFADRQKQIDSVSSFREVYLSSPTTPIAQSVTLPIPELIEKSAALGDVQAAPDSDGVFRHHSPGSIVRSADREIPVLSLPFAFYHLVTDGRTPFSVAEYADQSGKLIVLPHGGRNTYETYSLAAVMQAQASIRDGKEPQLSPDVFRDAWVILGTSAPGLLDLRPTPLEPRGNGLEFVAAVLDNLISGRFGRALSRSSSILMTLVLVLITTGTALFSSNLGSQRLIAFSIVALFFCAALTAAHSGYWIPVVTPLFAIVCSMLFGLSFQYQLEGKEREYLRSAFQFYVSPAVVERIVSSRSHLSLVGERRELSMFFSDIEGFTALSEAIEPGKLVQMLNEYLTMIADIIQESGGTVDKYVGDAVVAFWNAPLIVGDHALCAVQTAITCQRKLASAREHFLETYGYPLRTRIGVHTGDVSVGNFGSRTRFNYTVIGDSANLASRLEGANKAFGTQILISEATYRALIYQLPCRRIADLRVLGKTEPVRVYEPQIDEAQPHFQPEALERFERALEAYDTGNLKESIELFEQLSDDSVAKAYLRRLRSRDTTSDGTEWSPVWTLSEK